MNDFNQLSVQSQNSIFDYLLAVFIIAAVVVGVTAGIYFLLRHIKYLRVKDISELVMLKVILPKEVRKPEEQDRTKEDFREHLSVAEQFLSSLSGTYQSGIKGLFGQPRFSLEIIAKNKEIFFYVGVAKEMSSFMERQIHSFYPTAQIEESKDFKIFIPESKISLGSLKLVKKFVYPIKTYKNLEADPLNAITNAMSKLPETDCLGIQILLKPTAGGWMDRCSWAARDIQRGKVIHSNWTSKILYSLSEFLSDLLKNQSKDQLTNRSEEQVRLTPMQEETLKAIREKGSKVGFNTQIRIVVVSHTQQEANASLESILTTFSQYSAPEFNSFKKFRMANPSKIVTRYILREFSKSTNILNTEEVASIFHFPNKFIETPNIHWIKARTLPPPSDLPKEGTLIGESHYRGEIRKVYIKDDDRRRHMFMIGKTGVGKTTLYMTMIKQDIERGYGCAFLDPNGDAAEGLLRFIPKERAEDVIYFDPSDTERPMGLNMLEWKRPEDRDFLVAEWLEIFYKLFDPNRTGMVGPQFEHWGRNAALTVMAQPGGGSILEIPRLFTDDEFKDKCISCVKDPVVLAFWQQQMAKTADFHKSEMFNYFISKFGRFMTNDLMRNIIGQRKSAFDIRDAMESNKIIIINLSKGKIGEMNSYLLGMTLVSKIQVAAFQRADTPEEERKDFYLFVDEFQNFTTDSFKTILAEARKYKLNLAVANQYIQQLTEPIRDACIGNAGTLLVYRAGAADAEFMAKELPGVSEQDITNLPFATLYVKLLIDGSPAKPFSMKGIRTLPTQSKELAESIRQLSRLKYGRSREEVEEDIRERTLSQTDSVSEPVPPREA